MGIVNKDSPSRRASAILRQYARETVNKYLADVLRLMDSRLQYFINWEGSCREGEADHLSWLWALQSELRDLNYLGFLPNRICHPVCELLQEAVDHSREVKQKRHEGNLL